MPPDQRNSTPECYSQAPALVVAGEPAVKSSGVAKLRREVAPVKTSLSAWSPGCITAGPDWTPWSSEAADLSVSSVPHFAVVSENPASCKRIQDQYQLSVS